MLASLTLASSSADGSADGEGDGDGSGADGEGEGEGDSGAWGGGDASDERSSSVAGEPVEVVEGESAAAEVVAMALGGESAESESFRLVSLDVS